MYKDKRIIALIPARGGSKGLPKKNILPLLGKPLIAWTIEQALESKYLDEIIVSTDNEEIASISRKYGAKVPYLRPSELAQDSTPTIEVISHAIKFVEDRGKKFDILVLLEPTSPLREKKDIDYSIKLLIDTEDCESVVSVSKLESSHPEFNLEIDKNGFIRKYYDKSTHFNVLRRQELNNVYFFDGTIYISYISTLLRIKTFYHQKTMAYIVPKWKSLEIDDKCDFICVESVLKAKLEGIL